MNDLRNGPETRVDIGQVIVYTLYASYSVNLILVLAQTLKQLIIKVKQLYIKRKIRKISKNKRLVSDKNQAALANKLAG